MVIIMPQVARVADQHIGTCDHGLDCCPHNVIGVISSGSPDVFANGLQVARLNDNVIHDCPHCGTGYIASASTLNFANKIGIARIADSVIYPGGFGHIISASDDVFTS
jgi:uncharacterized Zn-binding protein involved in type VI secretion